MTDRKFDQFLREALQEYRPEGVPSDWEMLERRIAADEAADDAGLDEAVRAAAFSASTGVLSPDWSRMEQELVAEEAQFDDDVRTTVEQYDPQYHPSSWYALAKKFSDAEYVRRHLIGAKILEVAAICIALLTFFNVFPVIRSSVIKAETKDQQQQIESPQAPVTEASPALTHLDNAAVVSKDMPEDEAGVSAAISMSDGIPSSIAQRSAQPVRPFPAGQIPLLVREDVIAAALSRAAMYAKSGEAQSTKEIQDASARSEISTFAMLNPGLTDIQTADQPILPAVSMTDPNIRTGPRLRLGMHMATDLNVLYFPAIRFYTQGRQVDFTAQEMTAAGTGTGATLLFEKKRHTIETGIMYSYKVFSPERKLFLGTTNDLRLLDFESIELHVISVPVYAHWKFARRGAWRFYGTGGVLMNVIVDARYDLIATPVDPGSSAVQNPDLVIANTREVQRVREHLRDGATFSSKAYLTASGGLGVERVLTSRLSVYAQPTYQYQIPFFGLIDQQGKNLQSASLILGTRFVLY